MNYDSNLPLSAPSSLNQSSDLSFVRQELQHLVRSFLNSSDQRFGVIAVIPSDGKHIPFKRESSQFGNSSLSYFRIKLEV